MIDNSGLWILTNGASQMCGALSGLSCAEVLCMQTRTGSLPNRWLQQKMDRAEVHVQSWTYLSFGHYVWHGLFIKASGCKLFHFFEWKFVTIVDARNDNNM